MKKQDDIMILRSRENTAEHTVLNENTCVCCGNVIPEGALVCFNCERYPIHQDTSDDAARSGRRSRLSLCKSIAGFSKKDKKSRNT